MSGEVESVRNVVEQGPAPQSPVRRIVFAGALILLGAGLAPASHAQNAATLDKNWSLVDKCKKESFVKYPDQTSDGLEKRRVYVKLCVDKNVGANAPAVRN
jgi:hypothetical protein